MLFKRLVRELPEQVFVSVMNNIGSGTAVAANQALQWDTTAGAAANGVNVVTPATTGLVCRAGIADAAIPDQDYGLCQVYGYRSTSAVQVTNTSQAIGALLIPSNAVTYLVSNASTNVHLKLGELMESVASSGTSTVTSAKMFVRALG
jgi:hypothetical protein